LIKLTALTLIERILESKYLNERSMTKQTLYHTTLTLMTSLFDLNYYKDFRSTDQTHNSYPN